jgi:hypothetical protein
MKSYRYQGQIRNTSTGGHDEIADVDLVIDGFKAGIFFALVEATNLQGWTAAAWVDEPVVTVVEDAPGSAGD